MPASGLSNWHISLAGVKLSEKAASLIHVGKIKNQALVSS
jgi:hypothetical protein